MNQNILKRLASLLSVKSVVTVALSGAFVYLAVAGVISGQEFLTVYSVVIAFYFGTQSQKVQDLIVGEDK